MKKLIVLAGLIAVGLSPAALAQTKPTPSTDSAAEAKFKAADKNSSGTLEGAEADAYKAQMAQLDTNKDGKISRDEFMSGAKAGHVK